MGKIETALIALVVATLLLFTTARDERGIKTRQAQLGLLK